MVKFPHLLCSQKLGLITALLVLMFSAKLPSQTLPFSAFRDYPVGKQPFTVAVGDFNGDGKLDLVAANFGSNDVSVLLGKGDGTFGPAVEYAAGANMEALAVGDFNGDGVADILTVNGDSSVTVFLGNGNGTFQAPEVTAVVSNSLQAITVGDFNGDGKLDLAIPISVPQVGDSGLSVMLSKGDGTFAPATSVPGPIPTPPVMSVADINGDGKLDVVAGGAGVSVFLGNGDGTFQQPQSDMVGFERFLAIADFNGDSKPDVVFGSSILISNGDGTFEPPMSVGGVLGGPVAVGDFNGDGKADLIFGGDSTGSLLLGNGDGTFRAPILAGLPANSLVLGDFDRDGKLDVAATGFQDVSGLGSPDVVRVALGKGDGSFFMGTRIVLPSGLQTGAIAGTALFAGDLNRDGKPDLVEAQSFQFGGNLMFVLLGNGDGTFQAPGHFETSGSATGTNITGGDFNSDGKLDLAVISDGNVAILMGKGDGTFQPEVDYGNNAAIFVTATDVSGDGKLDIVTADGSSNTISVFLGNGDGTFGFATSFAVGAPAQEVSVGDFNKDGKPDVAVATGSSVAVLLGRGDGTFANSVEYNAGAGGTGVAVADLNQDGNLDLVASNFSANYISILLGKGDGTFLPAVNSPVGGGPGQITIADFNADGKNDIAVSNAVWRDLGIFPGNGDGRFQPVQYLEMGVGVATDLDGNGNIDLATPGISIWFNTLPTPNVRLAPSALTFSSQSVGTTSVPQTVTLTNIGNAPLTVTSISSSGDFAESDNCPVSINASASCSLSITFTPTVTSTRIGSVSVSDSASGSPHVVSLGGNGATANLGLGISPGGSPTATVTAGRAASYTLSIGGQGLGGTASLSCTGTPTGPSCSVPGSTPVSASTASTFDVSVSTTSRTQGMVSPNPFRHSSWLWAVSLMGLFGLSKGRPTSKLAASFLRVIPLTLLLVVCSCGGSSGPQSNSNGTPAGTYHLTVLATMPGSTSQSASLTLIVQ